MYEPRIHRKAYKQFFCCNVEALGWFRWASVSGWCCSIYLYLHVYMYTFETREVGSASDAHRQADQSPAERTRFPSEHTNH